MDRKTGFKDVRELSGAQRAEAEAQKREEARRRGFGRQFPPRASPPLQACARPPPVFAPAALSHQPLPLSHGGSSQPPIIAAFSPAFMPFHSTTSTASTISFSASSSTSSTSSSSSSSTFPPISPVIVLPPGVRFPMQSFTPITMMPSRTTGGQKHGQQFQFPHARTPTTHHSMASPFPPPTSVGTKLIAPDLRRGRGKNRRERDGVGHTEREGTGRERKRGREEYRERSQDHGRGRERDEHMEDNGVSPSPYLKPRRQSVYHSHSPRRRSSSHTRSGYMPHRHSRSLSPSMHSLSPPFHSSSYAGYGEMEYREEQRDRVRDRDRDRDRNRVRQRDRERGRGFERDEPLDENIEWNSRSRSRSRERGRERSRSRSRSRGRRRVLYASTDRDRRDRERSMSGDRVWFDSGSPLPRRRSLPSHSSGISSRHHEHTRTRLPPPPLSSYSLSRSAPSSPLPFHPREPPRKRVDNIETVNPLRFLMPASHTHLFCGVNSSVLTSIMKRSNTRIEVEHTQMPDDSIGEPVAESDKDEWRVVALSGSITSQIEALGEMLDIIDKNNSNDNSNPPLSFLSKPVHAYDGSAATPATTSNQIEKDATEETPSAAQKFRELLPLLVPSVTVGAVIGHNADIVRRIERDTAAKISAQKMEWGSADSKNRSVSLRVIEVSGSMRARLRACEQVSRLVELEYASYMSDLSRL